MGDDVLPKGQDRGLTTGEIELAKTVFGNSIDYSKVRIHNDTNNMFQGENVTVTPNGHLYCANNYCDDFSKGSKHHFIHEMTHVWQYQNNVLDPVACAAAEWVKSGFNYHACYAYKADPKKDLLDYNLEQQADMVADLWALKDRKANPEPDKPVTPEELEKGMFASFRLKALSDMYAKDPNSPEIKLLQKTGNIAFDKDGHPHFTQKYADEMNETRKKEAKEREKSDADLLACTKKFQDNPSYARKLTLVEEVGLTAIKGAIQVAPLIYPLLPRR
ncbi:MAG: hypothetical protein ACAH83_04570 [Alphaproteobacteria bacterium]